MDTQSNMSQNKLLNDFNSHNRESFGIVYKKFYQSFYYYTNKLFSGYNVDADDILQDIFINIWIKRTEKFASFDNLKAFIYVTIRNKFIDATRRKMSAENYRREFIKNEDTVSYIFDSELTTIVSDSLMLLPEECAKVMSLYLNGYTTKEIATAFNKTESTVYKQKREAISYLRKIMPKDKYLILLLILQ